MAELIFKKMTAERGLALSFDITSRGTSDEEEGNGIYPPAKKMLREHGIEGGAHLPPAHQARGDKRRLCAGDGLFQPLRRAAFDGRRLFRQGV